jgi:hypothetical protein
VWGGGGERGWGCGGGDRFLSFKKAVYHDALRHNRPALHDFYGLDILCERSLAPIADRRVIQRWTCAPDLSRSLAMVRGWIAGRERVSQRIIQLLLARMRLLDSPAMKQQHGVHACASPYRLNSV